MNKIYVARHGQDLDNEKGILNGHRDKALTKIGREQAKNLAFKMKKANISLDKIYSSPLKRAYQTAKEVKKIFRLNSIEILDLLVERDFGSMSGKKIADIKKLCSPHILKTKTISYLLKGEGIETFPQTLKRAQKVIKIINDKHQNKSLLLLTHGDFAKMLYAAYYNIHWKEALSNFHFGNSELLILDSKLKAKDSLIFNQKQYNL